MTVGTLERFTGPNNDILRPSPVLIPPPLPREERMRVAVIAEGAVTPLGNSSVETLKGFEEMRSGIVERRHPPYTDPSIVVPNEIVNSVLEISPIYQRVQELHNNSPAIRRFFLKEFLLHHPEVELKDLGLKEAPPQIRAITAGTVKDFDAKGTLVDTGIMPFKEVQFKMGPYAQYAMAAAFEAMFKIKTSNGASFLIPRVKADGTPDNEYGWIINKDLVTPQYVSTILGTGFAGGAVSAEVLQLLVAGYIPKGDHMMRSLADRGDSPVTQASGAEGGAEAVAAACASSGRAMLNAMLRIAWGWSEVSIVIGAEGLEAPMIWPDGRLEDNPITPAEFDCFGALDRDRGLDPTKVSRSLHKLRRGFTIAEGAVALVIADPDWARLHGIPILYEIVGAGEISGGGHNTEPNGPAQERAMRFARRRAEMWGPLQGKVFNSGHYTGTPLGEPSELLHTQNVLDDMREDAIIYATKRLAGHMLGAAGNLSQLVAGWVLQTGKVPGMVFDGEIMDELYGWNVPLETYFDPNVFFALVNQFGFGDANVSLWLRKVA